MDFACKKIDVEQVLKCSLGLTKAGCTIMHYLRKNDDWHTSEEIAKKTGYDLATTQRTLKHLYERGVVHRRQQNRDVGGYEYHYQIVSEQELQTTINAVLDDWVLRVRKGLTTFLEKKKK